MNSIQPSTNFFRSLAFAAVLTLLILFWASPPIKSSALTTLTPAAKGAERIGSPPSNPPAIIIVASPELPRTRVVASVYLGPDRTQAVFALLPVGSALDVVGRASSGQWVAVAMSIVPGAKINGWISISEVSGLTEVGQLKVAQVTPLPRR